MGQYCPSLCGGPLHFIDSPFEYILNADKSDRFPEILWFFDFLEYNLQGFPINMGIERQLISDIYCLAKKYKNEASSYS